MRKPKPTGSRWNRSGLRRCRLWPGTMDSVKGMKTCRHCLTNIKTDKYLPALTRRAVLSVWISNFRLSYCCGEADIPSPGGKVAERSEAGRGIREITLDVVQPEDFLKGQHFVCLIHFLCFYVSARIPLPPAVATLPPAPSPRGKVCACGAKEYDKSQFVQVALVWRGGKPVAFPGTKHGHFGKKEQKPLPSGGVCVITYTNGRGRRTVCRIA